MDFDDYLNDLRRRAGMPKKITYLIESQTFTAYKKEGDNWRFGFPREWTQEELYLIPYEQIDHVRMVNDPEYEKTVIKPNPDYRGNEVEVNMSNSNATDVSRFLRDVIKVKGVNDGPEGWMVPVKEFIWKVKAWQQMPDADKREETPEILPSDSHDPDSPVDPRIGDHPLTGFQNWERRREGNVVGIRPEPTGARVMSGGRAPGYIEKRINQLLKIAELAMEVGATHIGGG